MNKAELKELAKSLGASDEALKDKTNDQLKAIIADLKAKQPDPETEEKETEEKEADKTPSAEDDPADAPEETTPVDSYTDDRDITWQFKKSAPKTIRFDGRPMTQEEILSDESVISELVYGNSNLLTKKK